MHALYNFIVATAWQFLKIAALFNTKLALFTKGRKETVPLLTQNLTENDKVIWFHAASLGEYEQGLPIMEGVRKEYPSYKLVLTFFSPSGYEIKKNTAVADVVTYLPIDTKKKVKAFLNAANPGLVIFIKYEIWPNYLNELHRRNIPTLLISALFKKNQIYFKGYGNFMRNALSSFKHIYVQNDQSKKLLDSIGQTNVTVTGDTRLDRVSEILEQDNSLDFMEHFINGNSCIVAGSTWPEDEKLLVAFINKTCDIQVVIAPHNINEVHLEELKNSINKPTCLYSEIIKGTNKKYDVLIVDTIGLLTKIYSYADIAYVGGAFATGLHNTMEPAVFGIPVIIGPLYQGFLEAENLVRQGGIISVANKDQLENVLLKLISNTSEAKHIGSINSKYILNNKGASVQILKDIRTIV
ncbi:3-deoxy-D-manno-octulosonic acid transferase [Maribacter sp. CXY002]|uniref:3-deoxy-D-manno-octulosonic acid transferase n=1 Tax=Maribacter luteocoastalis TaxID=3407671 RepID=UPI003B67BA4A